MSELHIERVCGRNVHHLLRLIEGLATFEGLEPPGPAERERIVGHALAEPPLFHAFVAYAGEEAVGYITYYFTYSTFLARPTLFLEDIFVLETARKQGVGAELFRFCAREARAQGCGRMEWSVLTWNQAAIDFYERMGGKRLGWYLYRMDLGGIQELLEGR
jgi:GNAT superfamily N-acetyltransferase